MATTLHKWNNEEGIFQGQHTSTDVSKLPRQEVRKSSRPRRQSKKALSLQQSSADESNGADEPLPKLTHKKRRQPWITCSLCGKTLPKTERRRKKIGSGSSNGAQVSGKTTGNHTKSFCTKCARILEKDKKAQKPSKADREKFEAEGVAFGEDLSETLKDPEAKRLYCPFYQVNPCGCLQKYIMGRPWKKKNSKPKTCSERSKPDSETPGENAEFVERASFLLSLRKESLNERREIKSTRTQKKKTGRDLVYPENFTNFLLSKRTVLRGIGLCERGCQRVLGYSNNFLHKKVVNGPRLPPTKGKSVGVYNNFEDFANKKCCRNQCVRLAETHREQLESWREQASKNQKSSRKVITEMLTPNEKKHVNCQKFISMVTGSCKSTIMKTKTNMILGGETKPAEKKDIETTKTGQVEDLPKTNLARILTTSLGSLVNPKQVMTPSTLRAKTPSVVTPIPIPSNSSTPLIRVPLKTLAPKQATSVSEQATLPKQIFFKLLEDRHKKEREQLRMKQQEEKQQLQQQVGFKQFPNQNSMNSANSHILVPLVAASPEGFVPSDNFSKAQATTVTLALNHRDSRGVTSVTSSAGSSLHKPDSLKNTQMSPGVPFIIQNVMDVGRKPVASKVLSSFLVNPSEQALVPNSQLLPPSTVSPSKKFMQGSQALYSSPILCTISPSNSTGSHAVSSDMLFNALPSKSSSSSSSSSLGIPTLSKPLLGNDQISADPKSTTNSSQSKPILPTGISVPNLLTTQNSQMGLNVNNHSQLALNLLIGSNKVSQPAQNFQLATDNGNQSNVTLRAVGVSRPTQMFPTVTSGCTLSTLSSQPEISYLQAMVSPHSGINGSVLSDKSNQQVLSLLNLPKDTIIATSMAGISETSAVAPTCAIVSNTLQEPLPASDLQSIKADTLTYSNVSLTKSPVVVSSSNEKGQTTAKVVTLKADTPRASLDIRTDSDKSNTHFTTSASSSLPLSMAETNIPQQLLLSSKTYVIGDENRSYHYVVGDESHYSGIGQYSNAGSTASTSLAPTPSVLSSYLPSDFPTLPFSLPLQLGPQTPKLDATSAISSQTSAKGLTLHPESNVATQHISSDRIKRENVPLKIQMSQQQLPDFPRPSSTAAHSQTSAESVEYPAVLLGSPTIRAVRDRSQPVVGIVHPHITRSRVSHVEQVDVNAVNPGSFAPSSLQGSGQNVAYDNFLEQSHEAAGRVGQAMTIPSQTLLEERSHFLQSDNDSSVTIPRQGSSNAFHPIGSEVGLGNQQTDMPDERGSQSLPSGNGPSLTIEKLLRLTGNAFSQIRSDGNLINQPNNLPNSHPPILPLQHQVASPNQAPLVSSRGISPQQGLILSEDQLRLVLGTNVQQLQQQTNFIGQEYPTNQQHQFAVQQHPQQQQQQQQHQRQSQIATNAQGLCSLQSDTQQGNCHTPAVLGGITTQPRDDLQVDEHAESVHSMSIGQSTENMPSSGSVRHNSGGNIHDLQPTIQLLNNSNEGSTFVVVHGQLNQASGTMVSSELVPSLPLPSAELRPSSTSTDNTAGINHEMVRVSSATVQTTQVEIPRSNAPQLSTGISPSTVSALPTDNSLHAPATAAGIDTLDYSLRQPQPLSVRVKDAKFDEFATQLMAVNASSERKHLLGYVQHSNKTSKHESVERGVNLYPSFDFELERKLKTTPNQANNSDAPVIMATKTLSGTNNSIVSVVSMGNDKTVGEAVATATPPRPRQIVMGAAHHEVPVIQHTLDQQRLVLLAQDGNSSFSLPMTSSQGQLQIINNVTPQAQDSNSATLVISSLGTDSNELQMINALGTTSQVQGTGILSSVKLGGLAPQSFDMHNHVVPPGTHNSGQNLPSCLNGRQDSQTLSLAIHNSATHSLPTTISQISQLPILQTGNNILSMTQTSPSLNVTQGSQITTSTTITPNILGTQQQLRSLSNTSVVTSTPAEMAPIRPGTFSNSSFVTKRDVTAKPSPTKPRSSTVILVPDKPGFPRYQVTQLSPEPDHQCPAFESEESVKSLSTAAPATSQSTSNHSQQETILQLIAQSLMSQNLTLTNGTQIVLPFSPDCGASPYLSSAKTNKPHSKPSDGLTAINDTPSNQVVSSSGYVMDLVEQGYTKPRVGAKAPLSADRSRPQLLLTSSDIPSGQSPLSASALNQVSQLVGSEPMLSSTIEEKIDNVGLEHMEATRHLATHVIGNTKIGSLVKTSDSCKIGNFGNAGAEAETLKSGNTSSFTVNLRERKAYPSHPSGQLNQNQTTARFSSQAGLGHQPAFTITEEACDVQTLRFQEGFGNRDALYVPIENNTRGVLSQTSVANLRGTDLSNLLSRQVLSASEASDFVNSRRLRPPQSNASKDDISKHGSTDMTFSTALSDPLQLAFLHEKETVIDLTEDSLSSFPSQSNDQQLRIDGLTRQHGLQEQAKLKSHSEMPTMQEVGVPDAQIPSSNELLKSRAKYKSTPPLGGDTQQTGDDGLTHGNASLTLNSILENPELCAVLVRLLNNGESSKKDYQIPEAAPRDSVSQISQPADASFQNAEKIVHGSRVSHSWEKCFTEMPEKKQADIESLHKHENHPFRAAASPSSVTISLDETSHKSHACQVRRSAATAEARMINKRPCSLSQLNLGELSQNGERHLQPRARSISTSNNNIAGTVLSLASPYSGASLASSAVTFTRGTTSMDVSAGPPNVTLVSPTSLNRKQLQELENVAVLSQIRDQQIVDLPSETLSKESNITVGDITLPSSYLKQDSSSSSPVSVKSSELNINSLPPGYSNLLQEQSYGSERDSLVVRKIKRGPIQRGVDNDKGRSMPRPMPMASPQTKVAEKSPSTKPRKHYKAPTIRDILSQKMSTSMPPPHITLPSVSIDPSMVSSNSKGAQVFSEFIEVSQDKISHSGLQEEPNDTTSPLIISEGEHPRVLGNGALTSTYADILLHRQPESMRKAERVAERSCESNIETEAEFIGTSMLSAAAIPHLEFGQGSSPEKEIKIQSNIPINDFNNINAAKHKSGFNPTVKCHSSISQPKSDKEAVVVPGINTTPSTKRNHTAGNVLIDGTIEAKSGLYQIHDFEVNRPIVTRSGSLSHPMRAQGATSVFAKTEISDPILSFTDVQSLLLAKVQRPPSGSANPQPEYDTENGMYVKGSTIELTRDYAKDNHANRRRASIETEEGHGRPGLVTSKFESPHQLWFDARGDLSSDSRKSMRPTRVLTAQLSHPFPSVGMRSDQLNLSSSGGFLPSDRSQSSSSSSKSALAPSNLHPSSIAEVVHDKSSHISDAKIVTGSHLSKSIQNMTPMLSSMLRSSPILLRSGGHQNEEINAVIPKRIDLRTDEKVGTFSIENTFSEIDGQRYSVPHSAMKSPLDSHIPVSSYVYDGKFNHTHMAESPSANSPAVPRDRITSVIDNMYDRQEEDSKTADGVEHSFEVVPRSSVRSRKRGSGQSVGEHRLSAFEDDGQGQQYNLPKKKRSRRRTISNTSDSDHYNNSGEKQSSDPSFSESKSGKRTKSRKDGSSRERKKGTKSGASGRCQPKRVKFSDVVTNAHPLTVSTHGKSTNARASQVTSTSSSAIRDDINSSSSNFRPQDSPSIVSKFMVEEDGQKPDRVTLLTTPSTHGTMSHQSVFLDEPNSSASSHKECYSSHRVSQGPGISSINGLESASWFMQSPSVAEDYQRSKKECETINDSPTHNNITRHYQRGSVGNPRNLELRKETEVIVTRSLHSNGKTVTVESHVISPTLGQPSSHPPPEYIDSDRKELSEKGYPVTWSYPEEPRSSFDIISAHGYSKLAQQLRRKVLSSPTLTDHSSIGVLPSSSMPLPSSSRDTRDYLTSPWQASEDMDMDMSRLDRSTDSSVKRQIALQSDYALAQMMGQRQSHSRSVNLSMEASHQLLSESRSGYTPQPSLPEYEGLQEMTEDFLKHNSDTESARALASQLSENKRLKKAVAKLETQSRQRNFSAIDKQKSGETDFTRKYSSMPSSPFEIESIRRSPRTIGYGSKYSMPLQVPSSRSRNSSSQDGRSRNASGSYGLMNQHYGEMDHHSLTDVPRLDLDPSLSDAYSISTDFIPVNNLGFNIDTDTVLGHVEGLRVLGYPESEADGHYRHRNLSSSSLAMFPSSSSFLRYIDPNNIRSRNPSGSSNRRSRPGSCSSDRELDIDMINLWSNSPSSHLGWM